MNVGKMKRKKVKPMVTAIFLLCLPHRVAFLDTTQILSMTTTILMLVSSYMILFLNEVFTFYLIPAHF